jgi:hypothetical protein
VAGIPIGLSLWVYLREIVDLKTWGRTNPLGGVAARLMDQVETQIYSGQQQIQSVAADPALSDPATAGEALARYSPYIQTGRFVALAVEFPDGGRFTVPAALPAGVEAVWPSGGKEGLSALLTGPDGHRVVAMTAVLAGRKAPGGRLTGLFDVTQVVGAAMLDRMRVARWGEAFIADADGRIFLSANPGLTGRTLGDLGLGNAPGEDGLYQADGWQAPDGSRHFVALAGSHGYYEGPQNGWRVGLMVPEAVVGQRSQSMSRWIAVIILVILALTAGLLMVLRHSLRGAPR